MTERRWKFSQIISLAFVGAILCLGAFSSLDSASNTLMSDVAVTRTAK